MRNGTVLILNGASSSGKSSIVNALQVILKEPYLDAGIDKFIWMLPTRYLNRPLWDEVLGLATQAGPLGHRLISGMHQSIAALSKSGNNVIADHVLVEPSWLLDCVNLFSELPAYLIGVRCPTEILKQREKERKDRTWGQAETQNGVVHNHGIYDIEVDTHNNSPDECAQKIKAHIENSIPPIAFKHLKLEAQTSGMGNKQVRESPATG